MSGKVKGYDGYYVRYAKEHLREPMKKAMLRYPKPDVINKGFFCASFKFDVEASKHGWTRTLQMEYYLLSMEMPIELANKR